jgi:predicted signal transduction protein with EAL and GGDEF domain
MTDLYIWLTLLLSLPGTLSCALEVYEWFRKRKEDA